MSATYQSLAPINPPTTAPMTMSAAYSSFSARRRSSIWIAQPLIRNATIIIRPKPVTAMGPRCRVNG